MWKIPLFDLNSGEEEKQAVIKLIDSKWISMGEKTFEFEKRFSELTGIKHCFAVTNCTAALHMALVVMDIKEGDEVIVPSLTFAATVNCVKYVNATPVFADIKSYEDLTIDPEDIEKKIKPNTKALIVMHYGGFACDMDKLEEICRKYNLCLIEDAAHSPFSTYKEKKLGNFGDVSAFSFFSNKNITTAEGGMVCTNNDEKAKRLKLIRSHGMTTMSYERFKGHATKYDIEEIGYNYRIDDLRSAIGLVQLSKLKLDVEKRIKLVKRYNENLKGIDKIIIPFFGKENSSSNYIYSIVLSEKANIQRDELREKLAENGIQTSVHYPAVHEFTCYKSKTKLPKTEYVSENEITLPLYFSMTEENVDFVCDNLKEIIR